MKKLFLFLSLFLLSTPVFAAGFSDIYGNIMNKADEATGPQKKSGGGVCLDDGTGVLRQFDRPSWAVGLRGNLLDTPNGGASQFRTDNLDILLYHNLSNNLFVYTSYGTRSIEKNDYEGQVYDSKWVNQQLFGGVGIYITPALSVFGGIGQIWAEDGQGESVSIDTPYERGIGYDFHAFGNTVRVEYRSVTAPQSGESVPIEESTGDAGFSALSVSFVVAL